MAVLSEICSYLEEFMNPQPIADYCPNGLQIAGQEQVNKIISGVTACQDLIDAAVKAQANLILVHHGYFWKNEDPRLLGIKYQRIKTLINNNISLVSYHLPLDIHPEIGNNAQLAKILNIEIIRKVKVNNIDLLCVGKLAEPMKSNNFCQLLTEKLQQKPLHIGNEKGLIKTIAWCTGAAQDFIDYAIIENVDAYLTGEVSERTVHIAREAGIHFIAAGHHATERYGVKALGEHLAKCFNIDHQFIDIPNPV